MSEREIYRISLQDIQSWCDNQPEVSQAKNMDELCAYFHKQSTKGLWLRQMIKELQGSPISGTKSVCIKWIQQNVQVEEFESKPGEEGPDGEQAGPGTPVDDTPKLTLHELDRFFQGVPANCIQDISSEIQISDGTIVELLPVTYQDSFLLKYRPGLYENVAAIAKRNENRIVACGKLQRDGDRYHIMLPCEDISYKQFVDNQNYRLVLFGEDASGLFHQALGDGTNFSGKLLTVNCKIEYQPLALSDNTLCIDFGTSNTSAGSYGIIDPDNDHDELVSFTDVTSERMETSNLYPTMVYVKDCSDKSNIQYLFGYTAARRLAEKGYETDASVLYEIKRWTSSMNEQEKISDEDGRTASVLRRDIIKAYILHVIGLCQQYFKVRFKKLHMSAPVKLKTKFYHEMAGILRDEGYELLPPERSIDEGIAIVYKRLSELIAANGISADDATKIMILDCGGGTTDLASCSVTAKKMPTGMQMNISTGFVNGDSNFGGNNITYRILQLLKIKLAAGFAPDYMGPCGLNNLIPFEESEILSEIEYEQENGRISSEDSAVYKAFDAAYRRAEAIIPTIYDKSLSPFKFSDELAQIRRNYYYLWQLAERVKLRFYEADQVQVNFDRTLDKKLAIDTSSNYYLYWNHNGRLTRQDNPGSQMEITINEIRRVLYGEIFGLLNHLLSAQTGFRVEKFNYYRLAGQSCRITLFMELLKEFVPGNWLRPKRGAAAGHEKRAEQKSRKGSLRLKLNCIRGSVLYIRDQECGKIRPEIKVSVPKMIYDVCEQRGDTVLDPPLLCRAGGNSGRIGLAKYAETATKAVLLVRSAASKKEHRITINLAPAEEPRPVNRKEIFDEVCRHGCLTEGTQDGNTITRRSVEYLCDAEITADDSQAEGETVMLLFAVPSKEGYGMNIYRVQRQKRNGTYQFYWYTPVYENYEDESSKTFFNGKK